MRGHRSHRSPQLADGRVSAAETRHTSSTNLAHIALPLELLEAIFPFHLAAGPDLVILRVGESLRRVCPGLEVGSRLDQHFRIQRPAIPLTFDAIRRQAPLSLFVVESLRTPLYLNGQMAYVEEARALVFLGLPFGREVGQFLKAGLVESALRDLGIENTLLHQKVRRDAEELRREVEARTVELREANRQLAEASRHKSQFLANMSHELRTPLNAILGYTQLILDGIYGEVPEPIAAVLARVDKSGQHLLGLINDVLDLSKIEAGQFVLSASDYSIYEVVQSVVNAMEPLAAQKGLGLSVTLPADLPVARGDERRITQVLLNLVGNAVNFTNAGDIRIRVTTSGDALVVAVSDTGPGIARVDQQTIFEEFRQANRSTRKKGGAGLGLSIANKLVELHGGHMWVDSTPGEGSTFSFALPVRVEA